ncbi:MAG: apolipoprotein N-acyltransferase [Planctomycetota bacterium]|nr:apolipoprotein N-acyltransferase [Planctomycetota bacterium]GIK52809.1 MAG: apolipoprotein N-acyltransferase [Planctomycetota bacterium]
MDTATGNPAAAAPAPEKGRRRLQLWGLCLLSGLLLAYSTPPHYLPGLGLVALVPWLLALPRLGTWSAWGASYAMGAIYIGANTWWLADLTTEPGHEYIIVGMYVLSVLVRAFSIALAGVLCRYLLTRQVSRAVWLVPPCWLGLEFLHEFDLPGPYPWLNVASGLAWFEPFLQTADLWGAYGLSMALVFFNLAVARLFVLEGPGLHLRFRREGRRGLVLPAAASLLAVLGTLYGVIQMDRFAALERPGPAVGLVQGNLAQEVKVAEDQDLLPRSFDEHLALTRRALEQGAELVVWPETMVFRGATRDGHYYWGQDSSRREFAGGTPSSRLRSELQFREFYMARLRAEIFHEFRTPMLVGVFTEIPPEHRNEDWKDYTPRRHNSAMLLGPRGEVLDIHDKRNLVPGGENIPHEGNFLIRWITTRYADTLQGGVSLVEPGRRDTRFTLPGSEWQFTASICYEFAFARTHADLSRDQAPHFHVNLSNEGWFKRSSELDQAVLHTRLRAIETRVPQLRCTNTGVTCSIDACGRLRDVLTVQGQDREVQGVLVTRPAVLAEPQSTVFVQWVGGLPGYAAALLNLVLALFMVAQRLRVLRRPGRPPSQQAGASRLAG